MPYVIYNKETTQIITDRPSWMYDQTYKTPASAKAALTRMSKTEVVTKRINKEDYAVAEVAEFHASIEKKEVRHGIAGCEGRTYEVGVNTPWTSGPWSETYWCQ